MPLIAIWESSSGLGELLAALITRRFNLAEPAAADGPPAAGAGAGEGSGVLRWGDSPGGPARPTRPVTLSIGVVSGEMGAGECPDGLDLVVNLDRFDVHEAFEVVAGALAVRGVRRKKGRPRGGRLERRGTVFAHPSEEELARLLDFYQIRWEYEPRTFPVRFDPDGRVIEAFTPDFFLPDFELYLELTTLKQSLVARKNRKVREFREKYPDISLKVIYGRDYRNLLKRFGVTEGK